MKSEAVNLGGAQIHRPGTIVGKAQEPLAKGKGEISGVLEFAVAQGAADYND